MAGRPLTAAAAVLHEQGGPFALEEVEVGPPRAGEILVRIAGVGICHTDLAAADGALGLPLPVVLGHEGAGTVDAVGEGVEAVAVGDQVVLSYDHCGGCARCTGGHPAYCERFNALNASGARADGSTTLARGGAPVHGSFCGQSSFAALAVAGERNAIPVSTTAPLELLGPLGCSVQTGAGAVLEVLAAQPGQGIAVVGLGAVGLSAVMAAVVAGCDPIVAVDPDRCRRELAEELGATHALEGSQRVRAGVDLAVEAVGSQEALTTALRALASPGHCATVGWRGPRNPLTVDQGHLLQGRTLTGVIEGDTVPGRFIPRLLELHAAGRFPFERLITTFPFADIGAAVAAARAGEEVKPVLVL